jgi:HlyD family secretion protein
VRRTIFALGLLSAAASCTGGSGGPLTVSGTAEATTVRISSVLPGRIAAIDVDEGRPVKAGDVLFALDTVDLDARRAVAEAALAQGEAAIAVAKSQAASADDQVAYVEKEFKRIEGLAATGAVSARDLSNADNLRTQARNARRTAGEALAAAQAARGSAAANLDAVKVAITQATVRAPIDAVVLERLREPGEVVTAGGAVLLLGDLAHPWVRVFVPVTRLAEVKLGESAKVTLDSGESFAATVTNIADQAEFTPRDVQTPDERVKQVFAVKLSVEDGTQRLKPGMPVDVRFAAGSAPHARAEN